VQNKSLVYFLSVKLVPNKCLMFRDLYWWSKSTNGGQNGLTTKAKVRTCIHVCFFSAGIDMTMRAKIGEWGILDEIHFLKLLLTSNITHKHDRI